MIDSICIAEKREQYDRSGLARLGISFERAMATASMRISIEAAIRHRHRTASKQAHKAAINYQVAQ